MIQAPAALSTILVAVDRSAMAREALVMAGAIAERHEGKLLLMSACSEPSKRNERKEFLDQLKERLVPNLTTVTYLDAGAPADAIIALSKESQTNLVVMGSHGRDGVSRWLLGSVAEKVCQASHCPVLVVRGLARPKLSKLVVPIDGSAFSETALGMAVGLLGEQGEVVLVRAFWTDHDEAEKNLKSAENSVREQGLECRSLLKMGQASDAILEAAVSEDPDAVVMASHGRTGLKKMIFGSVAATVLRGCPCPLLTLPAAHIGALE